MFWKGHFLIQLEKTNVVNNHRRKSRLSAATCFTACFWEISATLVNDEVCTQFFDKT